jgi:hypothetical protein
MFRGQVNLLFALIGQGDVDLDKELAAREAASAETGLGPFGPGNGDPYVALFLGERLPTFGDSAEVAADSDLGGTARIIWDKGGVADLSVASTLPDCSPTFARFGVGHFHN